MITEIIFVALVTFDSISSVCCQHSAPGPIIDSPSFDYILQKGNNFSVFCEGNGQLQWSTPYVSNNNNEEFTQIEFKDSMPRHDGYSKASELRITNITYTAVGYYICSDLENQNNPSAALYLFVYDDHHLHKLLPEKEIDIVATQHKNAVIPCKPTSPDVEVSLMRVLENEVVPIELNLIRGGTIYGYRQFVGITTNDTTQIEFRKYLCYFRRGNFSVSIPISMEIEPETFSIDKPSIFQEEREIRNTADREILLRCQIKSHVRTDIHWRTPRNEPDNRITISHESVDRENPEIIFRTLTMINITVNDSGIYTCEINDYQNHENENSINVSIYENYYVYLDKQDDIVIEKDGYQVVQCEIKIDARPEPEVFWSNNKDELIPLGKSGKYEMHKFSGYVWLQINNVTILDEGNYTLIAQTRQKIETIVHFVGVTEKPKIRLDTENEFQLVGELSSVNCTIHGYPEPKVKFEFQSCFDKSCENQTISHYYYPENASTIVANVENVFEKSGVLSCIANHSIVKDGFKINEEVREQIPIYISDLPRGFQVYVDSQEVLFSQEEHLAIVTIENSITMTCGAYIKNYSQIIIWKRNFREIHSNTKYTLREKNEEFSNSSYLTINNLEEEDVGVYTCFLYEIVGGKREAVKSQRVALYISRYVAPTITRSNLNDTLEVVAGRKLDMLCNFEGHPTPTITWYKDNDVVTPSDRKRFFDNGRTFALTYTEPIDEGTYKCEGKNSIGVRFKKMKVTFKRGSGIQWYIFVIGLLIFLVFLSYVMVCTNNTRKKKLEKLLEEAGLANFEEGQLTNLNPKLGLDDQAELLPYNKKCEFPLEHLKLGKILGSGAFGVVVKGRAKGILSPEEETTVAVKLLDHNAEYMHVKALVSELKILIHLGKHLNVLNLLGACTKQIAKKKLLVILEYCRYGNLQTFLYRHREDFINQVNPHSGDIDFEIGKDILTPSINTSFDESSTFNSSNKTWETSNESGPRKTAFDLSREESFATMTKEQIVNKCFVKRIATRDLLSWSFQITKGMEYLVSRKVLHGDLAARNILLADDDVVKIADFGLAKSLSKMENYKKNSEDPLPMKWLSIESLRDRIFSTQSDVWSFGILLWELFSLARTPYPGMEANEGLVAKLEQGYRMEVPEFCTKQLYQIMLNCWSAKPLGRPSFTTLSEMLGSLLEDCVRTHYIKLNEPYLVMNNQRIREEQNDYITMVCSPNFENFSSPNFYVNEIRESTNHLPKGHTEIMSKEGDELNSFAVRIENTIHNSDDMDLNPI